MKQRMTFNSKTNFTLRFAFDGLQSQGVGSLFSRSKNTGRWCYFYDHGWAQMVTQEQAQILEDEYQLWLRTASVPELRAAGKL